MTMLRDVCTVRSSLVDPTRPEFARLPHIAPDSIEKGSGRLLGYRTAGEDGVTSGKYRFEAGDILYSKIRPNLNKVALVDLAGVCSADMYALDVDRDLAIPEYVGYVLRSQAFLDYATSLSNRANIPKLNREQLLQFDLHLPPLPEQRRIAAILDQADAVRIKRRQVVAHLDSLTQSIFNEMFADTEWPLSTLGDIAVVTSGITKGRKTAEPTQPVPYLAVSNVQAGHLRMDVVKEIEATAAEIARYALEDGDLVLTEGGDPDKLGRGTVWRSELPLCLHQNHIFRVRPRRDGAVLSGFLAAYMASRPARSYFLRAAKQTTGIASINMTQLKALPVALPPVDRQSLYLTRLDKMDAQRVAVQRTIATNDDLFASLQSRAFRGEL